MSENDGTDFSRTASPPAKGRTTDNGGQGQRFPREPHIADMRLAPSVTESALTVADLHAVLDGMSEGFALLGPDFTILDVNAEALRLDARPREAVVGRTHWDAFPGTEQSPVGALYKRVMRDRIPEMLEHMYRWPDGRETWLDMRAFPVGGDRMAIFYRDVTERHLTNTRLRYSEQRLSAAAKAFADMLWTNDANGRMIGDQPGWAAMTGQGFAEYQGYGWADAIHPDDKAPTIAAWQVAVAERRLFAFEHRVRRRDGSWRHYAIRAVPVLNDDGSLREWVGVHHDITDLRESELRFRQIAENIDAVIYILEVDERRISYVSPAYERVWQQPASALYADARSFIRDVHPDDRAAVDTALDRQRAGEGSEIRFRLVRPDGSIRHIHARSAVTAGLDTGARRIVGLAEDVTARTETRLQLQRNAETFETLVQGNPFGIYVIDSDFRLAQVSEGARKSFGEITPLLRRDFAEIMRIVWQEPYASQTIGRFRHTLATGEPYASIRAVEMRANIDAVEAYDWRIDRIVLPDGKYGVVCYFYDLSKRMALEASLQVALDDKDILLREIDHRVRNSLTIVASLLTMQSQSSDHAEVTTALEVAASRMHAIARVHEHLYTGATVGVVDFGHYLTEICRDLKSSLAQPGNTLKVTTVPVNLPIDQVVPLGLITNELVTNAFKHCSDTSAAISVELASSADCLTLTVADTGAGMPPGASNGSSGKGSSGRGLGMQVIKALTRQLGGAIAMPAPGGAAIFVVTVPIRCGQRRSETAAISAPE